MSKKPNQTGGTPKPRKRKAKESFEFAGRKDGEMKLFKTEEEAFEFAEPNSTIAKYKTTNGSDFDFVEVVGIKTSAGQIGRLLQS
jgi:hypothetical protein